MTGKSLVCRSGITLFQQKRLAVALNHVASVSGRMPRGWDRAYARYEFLAAVEREEYAGGYVRFQRGLISLQCRSTDVFYWPFTGKPGANRIK